MTIKYLGCVKFFAARLVDPPASDRSYGIYIRLASNKSEAERVAAEEPHHAVRDFGPQGGI